ncbi:hypothetical protein NQ315_006204 [Exocentrus adspersus]|uniref:Prefoldin subunit 4 n=1 Tax=Exocentrus adspersus TaxID=1586481 RepID=A0AAV8W1B7_9CUCU|nr:hypothetical protein NQ315_006204 [Exocentrus adspersus]
MAQPSNKGTFQPDSDVHITYEDQQKINRFARLNAKLDDYKEEIKVKENDLKSLEEACDEIDLFDEDEQIPYLVGRGFHLPKHRNHASKLYFHPNLLKCLKKAIEKIQGEIVELNDKSSQVRETMSELKSHLYGRFGSHINLEADDE